MAYSVRVVGFCVQEDYIVLPSASSLVSDYGRAYSSALQGNRFILDNQSGTPSGISWRDDDYVAIVRHINRTLYIVSAHALCGDDFRLRNV
jgi:hypothetical protein